MQPLHSKTEVHSLLSGDDLFLFNQGTHYRLYEKLGAHVTEAGTYFAVWAPSARSVSVIGDWNGWVHGSDKLRPRESSGIWEGVIKGVGHGTRYKYAVVGADGIKRDKADPFAARSEQYIPAGPKHVVAAQAAQGG